MSLWWVPGEDPLSRNTRFQPEKKKQHILKNSNNNEDPPPKKKKTKKKKNKKEEKQRNQKKCPTAPTRLAAPSAFGLAPQLQQGQVGLRVEEILLQLLLAPGSFQVRRFLGAGLREPTGLHWNIYIYIYIYSCVFIYIYISVYIVYIYIYALARELQEPAASLGRVHLGYRVKVAGRPTAPSPKWSHQVGLLWGCSPVVAVEAKWEGPASVTPWKTQKSGRLFGASSKKAKGTHKRQYVEISAKTKGAKGSIF